MPEGYFRGLRSQGAGATMPELPIRTVAEMDRFVRESPHISVNREQT
jgi:hypothetical protein